jgi:hypothetical protein
MIPFLQVLSVAVHTASIFTALITISHVILGSFDDRVSTLDFSRPPDS